jgi:transcriptional regulator with XRE-family HTH domain
MKVIDKELSVLEQHEVKTDWKAKAQWRRDNRRWLRYSGFIALTVIHRLAELKMSQKELAERMNCSPQYISKLLKGSENLTLDTISRLEECLNLDLVKTALSYVDGYEYKEPRYCYVAEPDYTSYGNKGDSPDATIVHKR